MSKQMDELLDTYSMQLEVRRWQRNAFIAIGIAFVVTALNLVDIGLRYFS